MGEDVKLSVDEMLNPVRLSNLLTSLDLLAFLPLLELWSLEITDDSRIHNAAFFYDPKEGRPKIMFSRTWAEKELKTTEEAVTILLHECLHFLLGYYNKDGKFIDPYLREAWEAFINQSIAVLTGGRGVYLDIVRRTFKDSPFPENFRCDMAKTRGFLESRVYGCLYGWENPGGLAGILSEEDTGRKYDYLSGAPIVPHAVFMLDPLTLADFFADSIPEEERKPRTQEEADEQRQQLVGMLAGEGEGTGEGSPQNEESKEGEGAQEGKSPGASDSPSKDEGSTGAGSGAGKESGNAAGGSGTGGTPSKGFGMDAGATVWGETPADRILPPEVAAQMLARIVLGIRKEVTEIPKYGNDERQRRYHKRVPASTKRQLRMSKYYNPSSMYSQLMMDASNADSLVGIGTAAGSGRESVLYTAGEREKVFLSKARLRQDLERVAELDDQAKVECLFKARVKKASSKTTKPSFMRDRVASSLVAQGRVPLMYRQKVRQDPSGLVHLYVDVSGSCADFVGKFLGFMAPMKDMCFETVHCFSTFVDDVNRDKLLKSNAFKSSGGTSLSCVLQHMKENKIRLACLMTDGYMSATTEEMAWAEQAGLSLVSLHPGSWSNGCQTEKLSTIVSSLAEYAKDKREIK